MVETAGAGQLATGGPLGGDAREASREASRPRRQARRRCAAPSARQRSCWRPMFVGRCPTLRCFSPSGCHCRTRSFAQSSSVAQAQHQSVVRRQLSVVRGQKPQAKGRLATSSPSAPLCALCGLLCLCIRSAFRGLRAPRSLLFAIHIHDLAGIPPHPIARPRNARIGP